MRGVDSHQLVVGYLDVQDHGDELYGPTLSCLLEMAPKWDGQHHPCQATLGFRSPPLRSELSYIRRRDENSTFWDMVSWERRIGPESGFWYPIIW